MHRHGNMFTLIYIEAVIDPMKRFNQSQLEIHQTMTLKRIHGHSMLMELSPLKVYCIGACILFVRVVFYAALNTCSIISRRFILTPVR